MPHQSLSSSHPANLPPSFITECDVVQYGISRWSAGVNSASCVPSQLLVHPQCLLAGGVV